MKHFMTIILFAIALAGYGQESATIKLVIKKINNNQGKISAGLYNSADTWLEKEYKGADTIIYSTEEVHLYFSNIPEGKYAVSIYHDENGNDELDTNMMGIPKEDYAFSNNATGMFGPAKYEDAVFEVSGFETIQTINLN